jgi:taurine dioxygenase
MRKKASLPFSKSVRRFLREDSPLVATISNSTASGFLFIGDNFLMKIRKISGALGAELSGVDLASVDSASVDSTLGLPSEQALAIRQALLDHQVIFLRNQDLTPAQFMAFAQSMGEPIEYPFVKGLQGFPHIIEVKKLEHEKVNFGGIWHSDTTYLDIPPMGSMLLAREVPPYGGDTMFANQYMAYEALSDTMKGMLAGLKGISSSAKADVSKTREDRIKSDGKEGSQDLSKSAAPKQYQAAHPIVRTHPETGRKSLYVNIAHTAGIEGLSDDESAGILKFLFEHQVKPEFTCRFTWEPHAIAFWDNRCALHNPINDYHGFRRVMHRITLKGTQPV